MLHNSKMLASVYPGDVLPARMPLNTDVMAPIAGAMMALLAPT
jgi:hypothetical protein